MHHFSAFLAAAPARCTASQGPPPKAPPRAWRDPTVHHPGLRASGTSVEPFDPGENPRESPEKTVEHPETMQRNCISTHRMFWNDVIFTYVETQSNKGPGKCVPEPNFCPYDPYVYHRIQSSQFLSSLESWPVWSQPWVGSPSESWSVADMARRSRQPKTTKSG